MISGELKEWQVAWRCIAELFTTRGLIALRTALETDDPRLIHGGGADTEPRIPENELSQNSKTRMKRIEGADAICFCVWHSGEEGYDLVGEVVYRADQICNIANGNLFRRDPMVISLHFYAWYDRTPRDEMRRDLLAEVELELSRKNRGA